MNRQISWLVELSIEPQHLDAYLEITAEMVRVARGEPGTLAYERYLGPESGTWFIYERYRSSAGAAQHLRRFDALFAARFHRLITRRRFLVFGQPASRLRNLLERFGAAYLQRKAGFSR